jgi:hypothetical protein
MKRNKLYRIRAEGDTSEVWAPDEAAAHSKLEEHLGCAVPVDICRVDEIAPAAQTSACINPEDAPGAGADHG